MAVNLKSPSQLPEVAGVTLSCVAAGLRYQGRDDLLLVELAPDTNTSAVFTQNAFAAAPVIIAKQHLAGESPRAMLINMGNANAATGQLGLDNTLQSCAITAKALNIETAQVLPFSTGVIGEQMDMQAMAAGIAQVVAKTSGSDWLAAAHSIMTTDTIAKATSRTVELDGQTVTINGIAKGAGMMCPNMATMLAFVVTDAPIDKALLDELLHASVAASFNRITVDSDTSTNDAVTLSATGQVGIAPLIHSDDPRVQVFSEALNSLMIELATSIVRDAEGATKFVKVTVQNSASQEDAKLVAEAVANSPLVKTALFASDPNWGRLPMAIGKSNAQELDADKVGIVVNGVALMANGSRHPDYTEELGQKAFSETEITIDIDLQLGSESYHIWTSDLSHGYVSINADYRS